LIGVTEEHSNALQKNSSDNFEQNVEDLDWLRDPFGVLMKCLPWKAQYEITDLKAK
jgi:hypothetical protein